MIYTEDVLNSHFLDVFYGKMVCLQRFHLILVHQCCFMYSSYTELCEEKIMTPLDSLDTTISSWLFKLKTPIRIKLTAAIFSCGIFPMLGAILYHNVTSLGHMVRFMFPLNFIKLFVLELAHPNKLYSFNDVLTR